MGLRYNCGNAAEMGSGRPEILRPSLHVLILELHDAVPPHIVIGLKAVWNL